jgi:sugar/nucleoside kinase (ribokinase family)
MDAVLKKPVSLLAATAIISLLLPFYLSTAAMSETNNETKITHTVPLGSTKDDVLRIMGKPNSPVEFDFSYKRGGCEILVTFSNKTDLVDAVIVIGNNPEYSLEGITVGSPKFEVKKIFGDPEKKYVYKKGGAECWLYPSEKVNFCIKKDKVASFSVCETKY